MQRILSHKPIDINIVLKYIKFKINFFIILATSYLSVQAQEYNLNMLQDKYPGQSEVILADELKYTIKVSKESLKIILDSYYDSMILNDNGARNYSEYYFDSELAPVRSHDAYIYSTKGKKIKTDLITKKAYEDNSIFHDDVTQIKVTYTNLEPGVRKILKYSSNILDPHLLQRFLFQKHIPTESCKITLEVDNDINIGYKIFNDLEKNIIYTKKEKRKQTIHSWKTSSMPAYQYDENMPNILYVVPHIAIYIYTYKSNDDKEVTILGTPQNLFDYYSTFVDKLNNNESSIIKETTQSIVQGLSSEEEKVKAIYYWVKDNIKYIAYENGYGGFIPREADLVCERKFGDCKDMSSIITAMCRSIFIENVNLAWIGTRRLPYTYEELPTPSADNHMIAAYVRPDTIIYLDATDQDTAFGLPSSFIQGKEALIRLDNQNFIIKKVPIVNENLNTRNIVVKAKIKDDIIIGSGQTNYSGLMRSANVSNFDRSNQKKAFNAIKSKVLLGNNKFELLEYTEQNVNNRDLPYIIDYKFKLENYIVNLDNEKYLNMFLKKYSFIKELDDDRIQPIEYSTLLDLSNKIILDIPNNMQFTELPQDCSVVNELLEYQSNYKSNNKSQVILSYDIKLKKLILYPEDFELWNESVKKIKKNMKRLIVLMR